MLSLFNNDPSIFKFIEASLTGATHEENFTANTQPCTW